MNGLFFRVKTAFFEWSNDLHKSLHEDQGPKLLSLLKLVFYKIAKIELEFSPSFRFSSNKYTEEQTESRKFWMALSSLDGKKWAELLDNNTNSGRAETNFRLGSQVNRLTKMQFLTTKEIVFDKYEQMIQTFYCTTSSPPSNPSKKMRATQAYYFRPLEFMCHCDNLVTICWHGHVIVA